MLLPISLPLVIINLSLLTQTLATTVPDPKTAATKHNHHAAAGSRAKRTYPHVPTRWVTDFGGEIEAESMLELEWTGGSGQGYVSFLEHSTTT
jgi:hypothetical protein